MALTLQPIDPDASLDLAPAIFNSNFQAIQLVINGFEAKFDIASSKIKLSNKATIPAKSYEGDTITLVGTSGLVLSVVPDGDTGGVATFTLSFDGKIIGKNITLNGTGADGSTIADLTVNGLAVFSGVSATFQKEVDFRGVDVIKKEKHTNLIITTVNLGSGASSPLDISKAGLGFIDASNSGSALNGLGDALVKIDTSTLKDGQVLRLQLFKKNQDTINLYNGGVGTEFFAFIDPNSVTGYSTISSTVTPKFDIASTSQCWIDLKWVEISSGNFKLVILDSKGMLNVS